MGFDGLPIFIVEHLQRIAKNEGFAEGYDVKHESGSKNGDGFCATLLSITLVGERRKEPTGHLELNELPLICKVQPFNAARQESFSSELMFQREVYMYTKFLPALAAFQKEHNIADDLAFTSYPKCYAAFHENGNSESVIIMEDLRPAGFEMWKKNIPTDFDSVRLLMEQLGRLHGFSIAIRDQKPELFKEFQELSKHFYEIITSPGMTPLVQSSFAYAISLMDNSKDAEAIACLAKDNNLIFADGLNAGLLGQYSVFCHGDCWRNNMLFVIEKESAKSITLLDWQLSRVTSPAVDLSNFLLSATDKSMRDTHLDEFLSIYYSNLVRFVRATGSDPDVLFPEAELQRQLRQFGIYGVLMAPVVISVLLADSSEVSNMEEIAEAVCAKSKNEVGAFVKLSDSKAKAFCQRMKDVLADARQYGWLN